MSRKFLPQRIPAGETPTVRVLCGVRGDYFYAGTYAPPGTYKAYMNRFGAVSVIAENGRILGLRPHEFEWVEGRPSMWGHGSEQISYYIEPYEGDWTHEAAEALLNPAIDGDGVDHPRVNHPWAKEGVS